MNLPKRLAVDGKTYCELATSRRSVSRSNEPGQSTLGLFDAQSQVLFVTTEKELQKFTNNSRFMQFPPNDNKIPFDKSSGGNGSERAE